MNEDIIYEKEIDLPENWESDTILIKNEKGEIVELDIPDDIEEG